MQKDVNGEMTIGNDLMFLIVFVLLFCASDCLCVFFMGYICPIPAAPEFDRASSILIRRWACYGGGAMT